ncbi:MAG: response regulator, partial [Bdellovibrionales bacterium]|nr:response regulator [Bdellovibrionales bacterium]
GSGPNGLVVVFRDISAEREIELELLKAQKLESVGELAGGIAHDFNNLLAAILGNVSLALLCATDSGSGELRELLKTTEEACLRAKGLTDQLLTFSKGGAPIKKPVNVFDLLEESIRLSLGGSSLHCEVEGDPSSSIAEGDPGQLVQVFNNLFINAKQAMPAGGAISVSCRRTSQGPLGPERDCIEIQVIDSGIGIPAHLLDRVCDPYFTTKSKGSGLGLATAYSIIKQHGGKLQIRSIEGKGTSISIYLLASDQIVGESSVSAHRPKFHQGSGRILLMDDDPLVREVAGRMLKALGYEIEIALDGREAISKYVTSLEAGTRFKAAILDLTVKGGLGGRETAKQLLDVDPTATLIVSSGYSSSAVASRFEQFGFSGVLAKPYNLDALAQILSQVLRLEASQDKEETPVP